MTFSIVGFDPKTKELGVAVASKFLAVGAFVPYAKAGVGAVATQSWVNPNFGPDGLDLMSQGKDVEEIVKVMTDQDDTKDFRQFGIVDGLGNSATFTGNECYPWAGGIAGEHFACQGNILTDENVVKAMVEAFQNAKGELAERLVKALQAGEKAGGDSRGKQSASLLVVKEKGGYGGANDRYIDLRVDDHVEPVDELERLLALHQLYFKQSSPEDILAVEGELKANLIANLTKLDYIKMSSPTDKELFELLKSFQLIENFDERLQEEGFIDRKVVDYMEDLVKRDE